MKLKVIKTAEDYQDSLQRMEEAKMGTPEGDELEILTLLINQYETETFSTGSWVLT